MCLRKSPIKNQRKNQISNLYIIYSSMDYTIYKVRIRFKFKGELFKNSSKPLIINITLELSTKRTTSFSKTRFLPAASIFNAFYSITLHNLWILYYFLSTKNVRNHIMSEQVKQKCWTSTGILVQSNEVIEFDFLSSILSKAWKNSKSIE